MTQVKEGDHVVGCLIQLCGLIGLGEIDEGYESLKDGSIARVVITNFAN